MDEQKGWKGWEFEFNGMCKYVKVCVVFYNMDASSIRAVQSAGLLAGEGFEAGAFLCRNTEIILACTDIT